MSVLEKFKLVELITTRTDAVATFITGNQIKLTNHPIKEFRPAPAVGADIDEIMQEFGYTSEEISAMRANNVF